MYSFSQNFEDVYIRRAFSEIDDGFYIDAGAYDPVVDSVTKMLYDLGWSGINLEPGPSFVTFASRTRDINLSTALGSTGGVGRFQYVGGNPGTSRILSGDSVAETAAGVSEYDVPMLSLGEIVAAHAHDRHIHFVKLDIEGGEWDVLRTTDWRSVRPELLIVECTSPYSNIRRDEGWAAHMAQFDYDEVFFDGINVYYLRQESAHRRGAFDRPVNVLDGVRKFDPIQHGAAATAVAQAENQAATDALREELKAAEAALAHQARAQDDHLAMIATMVASITPDDDPGPAPSELGNSAEAQLHELGRRIEAWKVARDAAIASHSRERHDALAKADVVAAQLAKAQVEAADALGLKARLTEARRSRARLVEIVSDLAIREKKALTDIAAEQTRRLKQALERERSACDGLRQDAETTRTSAQIDVETTRRSAQIDIEKAQRAAQVEVEQSRSEVRSIASRLAAVEAMLDQERATADREFAALCALGDADALRVRPKAPPRMMDTRSRAIIREADGLRDGGDPAGAARAYAEAYRRFPERIDLCVQLANALKDAGETVAAEQAYREALARCPHDPDIFLQIGRLYVTSGQVELARMVFRRSVELSTGDAPASVELLQLDSAD